jgi:hypothetical protein
MESLLLSTVKNDYNFDPCEKLIQYARDILKINYLSPLFLGKYLKKYEGFPWRTIQVTGKLSFEDWPCPEITSKGKTYELMVPRYYSYDIKVEAGQTVTVEGYLVEKGRRNDEKQYIKVTKAVIYGKEYELATPPCPYHNRR